MQIKNKLTIIYTTIVSLLLICINLYIFFLSRSFTVNNFYTQLKDRAIIAATVFLEEDEQSSTIIQKYQNKYLHTLPHEVIRIYDKNNKPAFIEAADTASISPTLIQHIRKNQELRLQQGKQQLIGIYYEDNQGNFVIIVSATDIDGIQNLNHLANVLIFGFILSIIIVFFSGRYFTKLMLRPITLITDQSNIISETNLHLRLSEGNKKDEIAELSITINKMLARLESAFELQKSFIANASHEFRTPLTSIIGNIEVSLSKARTVEEHKLVLQSILHEAEKLHRLTNGLLDLAQSNLDFSNITKDEIRIDEILLEIKDELRKKRRESNVELNFLSMPESQNAFTIQGDSNLLHIALLNLIDNACKFSDGKKVNIYLSVENQCIKVKIKDNGIGIGFSDLPHIKETFFRASNARTYSGSGIGLSLADKIITLHGGKLEIFSEQDKGTEVTVIFFNEVPVSQ